jgi:amino acid adenylation domain-containing protein/non-ribosomal peptide synthase protein (TIGR01720 family)
MQASQSAIASDSTRQGRIASTLTNIWAHLLGVEPGMIDASRPFIDMGAHSLLLLQASRTITEKFGVKVPFRAMVEEYPTITALAAYIERKAAPEEPSPAPSPSGFGENGSPTDLRPEAPPILEAKVEAEEKTPASRSSVERILTQQLRIMERQIEVLSQGRSNHPPNQPNPGLRAAGAAVRQPSANRSGGKSSGTAVESESIVFHEPIRASIAELNSRQQGHLDDLIARLTRKTRESKRVAQEYRRPLADNRATAGFRLLWKEMQYPLISERAAGARFLDIDGNEYVDITMGFGTLMFGHSPPFITETIQEQIRKGLQLGAESLAARESAELICKLTGAERVAFCNSGTEAVMMALRLARAVTGRARIALFEGCYHGTFDGVLIRSERNGDGGIYAAPMAPGVPDHMIENVLLLRYNDPESLNILEARAHELAAVLLEPIPSRMPGARPKEFLMELRRLTERAGAALIFDEVVSGFRFHIGGAQALFGVQADIVTYGKAIGGGMPVAAVAGKASYLDPIDGGMWSYGDRSYPQADTTFCAGTYFKHPFVMSVLRATLDHLKDNTPEIHERLNQNTTRLAQTLNSYFEREKAPIRVSHFGSLFRFLLSPRMPHRDLFYYHLLDRSVYIAETRTCYLSTAHTQEDIDFVVEAVKATVEEMRKGEMLPSAPSSSIGGVEARNAGAIEAPEIAGSRPEEEDLRIPLTEAQKHLWLETKMGDEASRAYNEPIILPMPGPFDAPAMREAINRLIDRHEALRVTFSPDGDYQLIRARLSIDAPLIDFSHFYDDEREPLLREWLEKDVREVFDLENGPLLRVRITKLAENLHILFLTIHHLITDGRSNDILTRELVALYLAHRENRVCRLPEPMRFSEYVRRQSQLEEGPSLTEDENYWLEHFASPSPTLDLPIDRPRPELRTYNGARQYMSIGAPLYIELKETAARQGCTLFMLLLGAFSALMHRLSGQDDLVVGIPSAGESLLGDKPLVGYFLNILPFRSRLIGDPTFEDHIAAVRRVLLDAYEHQNYPFGKLIRKLNIPRDPGRPTLVTVIFNLDVARPRRRIPGPAIGAFTKPGTTAKFDISLDITDTGGELKIEWEFNTDLFDAGTIHRWTGYFRSLLNGAAADPRRPLSGLEILCEKELRQALVEWNNTAADYLGDKLIHDLIREQAERTPDRLALIFEDRFLTYAELETRADLLARYLRGLGVGPESIVGVFMERSLEMVLSLLAILKAGGAYLPLDPDHPRQRLATIMREAGLAVVLTQQHLRSELPQTSARVVCPESQWAGIADESAQRPSSPLTADNLAYVIFTSGSTGEPKGSMLTHRGLFNRLVWMQEVYQLSVEDRVLQKTPFSFDVSVWEFFWPLMAGAVMVVARPQGHKDNRYLARLIEEEEVSVVHFVPSMLQAMLRWGGLEECETLRQVICSGEALGYDLQRRFYEGVGARLDNLYGPTEASIDVTRWSCPRESEKREAPPIGRPIANTRIYILGEGGRVAPLGVKGEIHIGGVGVGRGYLNRADLTAERFIPNEYSEEGGERLYRTGDVGRYRADGNIEYVGRVDDQVKIRGNRIEPAEIEKALLEMEGIGEAVVIAREEAGMEKRLVAYVVSEAGKEGLTTSGMRRHLKGKLPEHMIPSAFVMMESLPITSNGKMDRKALPRPEQVSSEKEKSYEEPVTPVERLLAGIWAQTLGIAKVGAQDNFFDLGGDSILGMQIVARANQAGLRLDPRQIFQYQTISELAAAAGAFPDIQAGQGEVTGPVRFTPILHWFFDQRLQEPSHFNLSNLFEIPQHLDATLLEKAVEHLLARHDALRLRYVSTMSGPQLVITPYEGGAPFSREDLSSLPVSEQRAAIEARAAELQTSLNIVEGPLMRVAFFDLGEGKPGRLLMIIHHLAVDIVSWPILVEDLLTAYRQLRRGEPVELQLKTTSFKEWAERLNEYARSPQLRQELSYWLSEPRRHAARLPVDFTGGDNTEGSARTMTVSLTVEETQALLHEAPRFYRAQVQETLLTALAQAFAQWSGSRTLLVDVESHGREALFEDIDLLRTVGWFTSVVPMLLDLERSLAPEDALRSVKEQLRSIPNGGLGHGLLRYLSGDAEITAKLESLAQAEVSFNYIGRIGGGLRKAASIVTAGESSGPTRSPRGARRYLLDVNVMIVDGALQAHLTYNENVHLRSTIDTLANRFIVALRDLINHCLSRESVNYTPSDFPLARLDERKLNRLAKLIDKTGKSATARSRTASVSPEDLVKIELPEDGRSVPLIVQPAIRGADLIAWAADNRALIETYLLKHGAILFRNSKVKTAAEFGRFMRAVCGETLEYRERSSPRHEVGDRIYTSTDYPAEQSIFPHNENSYAQVFPSKLGFFCMTPAKQGGETPLYDCRRVFLRLDPEIRERFMEKRWMYVRNFGAGFGLGWEEVFQTNDRAALERHCRENGIEFKWKDGNRLRTRQVRPAVLKHPQTGEMVWFNHVAFFHVSTLPPEMREGLLATFEEEDLPNNTYYGDGSPIEPAVLDKIRDAYMEEMVLVRWRKGDIALLDNMLMAHGRRPFVSPRKILVAMAEPRAHETCQEQCE